MDFTAFLVNFTLEVLPVYIQDLKGHNMAGKKGKKSGETERKRVIELRKAGYSISKVAVMLNR